MDRNHTVIIAVHCEPEGTELDAMIEFICAQPGVRSAIDIDTIDTPDTAARPLTVTVPTFEETAHARSLLD